MKKYDFSIIYGHNMGNGTMFGTLKTVLDSSWRKNADNMIVNFDLNNQSLDNLLALKMDASKVYTKEEMNNIIKE